MQVRANICNTQLNDYNERLPVISKLYKTIGKNEISHFFIEKRIIAQFGI